MRRGERLHRKEGMETEIRGCTGFPGGAVVKNLPANAGGSSGKIPHAAKQLSPCATTSEPAL